MLCWYDGRMAKRRGHKGAAAGSNSGRGSLHERLRDGELRDAHGARGGSGGRGGRAGSGGRGAQAAPGGHGGHGSRGGRGGREDRTAARPAARSVAEPLAAAPLPGDPRERIAIVGGGAAGLAAAVEAARALRERGMEGGGRVVVFEADERVGRSILATGNGRCNFSNAEVFAGAYRNARFVGEMLIGLLARGERACAGESGRYGDPCGDGSRPDPVHRFFEDLGMLSREEGEGRLYPATGKASTVVDVLRAAAAALGAVEACGRRVERIEAPREEGGLFHLRFADGSIEHAAAVIVAVGGKHALPDGGRSAGGKRALPAGSRAASAASGRDRATHGAAKADPRVAAGRSGAAALLPDRYEAEPPRPVLGPLAVREQAPRTLDNIRVRTNVWLAAAAGRDALPSSVRLDPDLDPAAWNAADDADRAWANEFGKADASCAPAPSEQAGVPCGRLKALERGEVLFRSYGVSGICVFNLSRFAEPGDVLLIDVLPQVRAVDCEQMLRARYRRLSSSRGLLGAGFPDPLTSEAFLRGMLLPAVARIVLEQAGVDPAAPLAKMDVAPLARALKALPLTVTGIGDERQCQVLRGGLSVAAFDPRTMGSRLDAGLFAAGEALDVDAPCGGYNLHWAWASGLAAGASAARFVAERLDAGPAPHEADGGEAPEAPAQGERGGKDGADGAALRPAPHGEAPRQGLAPHQEEGGAHRA